MDVNSEHKMVTNILESENYIETNKSFSRSEDNKVLRVGNN